jgi:hypothetical protein
MRRALLIGLAVVIGLAGFLFVFVWIADRPHRQLVEVFEAIKPGNSRGSVVALLGEPPVTTTDCYVAQFIRFEDPPKWTQTPTAAYCSHWLGPGISGMSFTVGFGTDGKVVGIAYGDS